MTDPRAFEDARAGVPPDAMSAAATRAARLLQLMGHGDRLMVLCHLTQGELSVGALREKFTLSQSALSQHLAKLRAAGLVKARRDGPTVRYSLASPEAAQILHALHALYCAPLVRDA